MACPSDRPRFQAGSNGFTLLVGSIASPSLSQIRAHLDRKAFAHNRLSLFTAVQESKPGHCHQDIRLDSAKMG